MECRGDGGDRIKPKPSTLKSGPLPFPALLCFWRVLDVARPIAARRGPDGLGGVRCALSAVCWRPAGSSGLGGGGRAPVLGLPAEARGAHLSSQLGGEISVFF